MRAAGRQVTGRVPRVIDRVLTAPGAADYSGRMCGRRACSGAAARAGRVAVSGFVAPFRSELHTHAQVEAQVASDAARAARLIVVGRATGGARWRSCSRWHRRSRDGDCYRLPSVGSVNDSVEEPDCPLSAEGVAILRPHRQKSSIPEARILCAPAPTFLDRPIMDCLSALILHNLFGRFPSLPVLSVENGIGWVPYLLSQLDKV